MRTQQHIIDTKAVKKVLAAFPDHWVLRDLSERDYGIDMFVEVFVPFGSNIFGETFRPTGATCHLQIKGTTKAIKADGSGHVAYRVYKKAIEYAERFSSPFFLIRTSVEKAGPVYFLWLQRYVRDVLDLEQPEWRELAGNTKIVLRIPAQNNEAVLEKKIEKISFRPKYIEELAEYREIVMGFIDELDHLRAEGGSKAYMSATDKARHVGRLRRIRNLSVLLTRNDCCVDRRSIVELIAYLEETERVKDEFPDRHNIELLMRSLDGMLSVEDFVADNIGETVY